MTLRDSDTGLPARQALLMATGVALAVILGAHLILGVIEAACRGPTTLTYDEYRRTQ